VTLRPAAPEDAKAIHTLLARCGQNWTRHGVESELGRETARSLLSVDAFEEHGARIQAVLLGWLTYDVAEITMIAVDPDHRRQGNARRILEAWHEDVRRAGARVIWLDVRPTNAPARALYAACGYRWTGTRPRYYQDGEDAILMERTF
jgi:[ribosomal protein S18]-alanine N-acetyltransferase